MKSIYPFVFALLFSGFCACDTPKPAAQAEDKNDPKALFKESIKDTAALKMPFADAYKQSGADSIPRVLAEKREKTNPSKEQYLSFPQFSVNVGTIPANQVFNYDFKCVNNISGKPIVIRDVKALCGCTTPSYTKESIPPGGEGTIRLSYNPDKDQNKQVTRTVVVYYNTVPSSGEEARMPLSIHAEPK